MRALLGFTAASMLAATLGSGCYVRTPAAYVTYADPTPPLPMVEEAPPTPQGGDYAWVNGYWYWDGMEYRWVAGYWAPRPAPGYVWVRSGWVVVDGRHRFVPGRWSVRSRAPAVTYVHPAPRVRVGVSPRYRAVPRGRRSGSRGTTVVRP